MRAIDPEAVMADIDAALAGQGYLLRLESGLVRADATDEPCPAAEN